MPYSISREAANFLIEQFQILEESIVSFKSITDESIREKLAENLMIISCRYLFTLLYERALNKLVDSKVYERWSYDCKSYSIDSTAISKSCLYRIQNY